MARSFTTYLHEYFYEELFNALDDYIDSHTSDLRNKYSRLHKIGTVELSDMDIKTVHVDDGNEMDISMEIVVSLQRGIYPVECLISRYVWSLHTRKDPIGD